MRKLPCSLEIKIAVCQVSTFLDKTNTKSSLLRVIVSIKSLTVTNAKGRTLLTLIPDAFPATRVLARRPVGDDSPVEYIQVQDASRRLLEEAPRCSLTESFLRTPSRLKPRRPASSLVSIAKTS